MIWEACSAEVEGQSLFDHGDTLTFDSGKDKTLGLLCASAYRTSEPTTTNRIKCDMTSSDIDAAATQTPFSLSAIKIASAGSSGCRLHPCREETASDHRLKHSTGNL